MTSIVGHTMGTPEATLPGAIDLFAALDLDGIEIICADDYPCGISLREPAASLKAIGRRAEDSGLMIAGLVPYSKDTNSQSQSARAAAIAELKRVVDMAAELDCRAIRVFGGHEVASARIESSLMHLADSLRQVGNYAQAAGVQLNIENHMDTMATSAAMTRRIADAVDLPNVGILYDQANLSFMRAEGHEEAIPLQWRHIRYVHAKDFYWRGGERVAAQLGDGGLPWREIVRSLIGLGYDGLWSLEYERRWYPDQLPAAEIGMKASLDFLRRAIASAEAD